MLGRCQTVSHWLDVFPLYLNSAFLNDTKVLTQAAEHPLHSKHFLDFDIWVCIMSEFSMSIISSLFHWWLEDKHRIQPSEVQVRIRLVECEAKNLGHCERSLCDMHCMWCRSQSLPSHLHKVSVAHHASLPLSFLCRVGRFYVMRIPIGFIWEHTHDRRHVKSETTMKCPQMIATATSPKDTKVTRKWNTPSAQEGTSLMKQELMGVQPSRLWHIQWLVAARTIIMATMMSHYSHDYPLLKVAHNTLAI